MNFTLDFVQEEELKLNQTIMKKFPKDSQWIAPENQSEIWKIRETIRALYVMEKWQRDGATANPVATLKHYSIQADVIQSFIKTYVPTLSKTVAGATIQKSEKRKDKYGSFDRWADEHRGEEHTTEQLVEVSGFSYQTTLKHVSESPLFIKVKKGLWRIADPKDDTE